MKNILLIILFLSVLFTQAQTGFPSNNYHIEYSYDAAGNRIKRETKSIFFPQEHFISDTVIEELGGKELKFYPNPIEETLVVNVKDYSDEIGNVKVFDIQGKLVIDQNITSNPTYLDFLDKAKGSYLVIIDINGEIKKYTVIK